MAFTTFKDQVTEGIEKLITQWQSKPDVVGLLSAYLENLQTVEDIYEQLLNERNIYVAVGVQLDVIGIAVGEARQGRGDEPYRQAILNRIALNNANTTPENIMELMKTVTGATKTHLTEHYPASFHLYVNSFVGNNAAHTLDSIAAAGVDTRLMFSELDTGFKPAEAIYLADNAVDQSGNQIVVVEGSEYNLKVSNFAVDPTERSYLPELGETGRPLCDAIDRTLYDIQTGFVIDDEGNFVIDDEGNNVRWTEVEVRA